MTDLKAYHADAMQTIMSNAEHMGYTYWQSLYDYYISILVESGDFTDNVSIADYIKPKVSVHAFDYDREREIFSLILVKSFETDALTTLTKQVMQQEFAKLRNFLSEADNAIHDNMDEIYPHHDLAYTLYCELKKKSIKKIRLVILTDGKLTSTVKNITSSDYSGIPIDFLVVDVEYMMKALLSHQDRDFIVDGLSLPCLQVDTVSDEYESYLTVISGDQIYDIYNQFGHKLLEQNVRTFLQFRAGVNKGIRYTIENHPDKFFAYNNGITATASEVEIEQGKIKSIHNFQVVNGGQTVSSIYASKKKLKRSVSDVFVQMKLSVVKSQDHYEDFVSKVSEYANTQNKVNKSDFFSNSPFHRDFKMYSDAVSAPVASGLQKRTKWYYERVRGQYLNDMAYKTSAAQKNFQLEYPKSQLIDKTLLAKAENSWRQQPHVVSMGAQRNFANFAEHITALIEKSDKAITEEYFKDAVAKVILFKTLEKLVSNSSWYTNGYRANIVTYTMAALSSMPSKVGKSFDLSLVWDEQSVPNDLLTVLNSIARQVNNIILQPDAGIGNIGEWCKKSMCWDKVKKHDFGVSVPNRYLIDREKVKLINKDSQKTKKIDNELMDMRSILMLSLAQKKKLVLFYEGNMDELKPSEFDVLRKFCHGVISVPTPKQTKIIAALIDKAQRIGLEL